MANRMSENRDVAGFDRVSLTGTGHLTIEPGDRESLRIEADSEMMADITTTVRDGKLTIGRRWGGLRSVFGSSRSPSFFLTVKELNAIAVAGAGKVSGSGLCADHLDLHVSGAADMDLDLRVTELITKVAGSGKLRLSGHAEKQKLVVSGTARYLAGELRSRECVVRIAGSGSGTVNVSEQLDVKIGGVGKVSYIGNPEVRQRISGVGSVKKIVTESE